VFDPAAAVGWGDPSLAALGVSGFLTAVLTLGDGGMTRGQEMRGNMFSTGNRLGLRETGWWKFLSASVASPPRPFTVAFASVSLSTSIAS